MRNDQSAVKHAHVNSCDENGNATSTFWCDVMVASHCDAFEERCYTKNNTQTKQQRPTEKETSAHKNRAKSQKQFDHNRFVVSSFIFASFFPNILCFFSRFFSHPFLRFGALALFNRLSCSHTQTHNDKLGGTCPLPCMQKWNFAIRSRREAIKQLALSLCRWWRRTMMLSLCVVHLIRGFQAIQLKTNASLASHVSFSFALQIHFKMA